MSTYADRFAVDYWLEDPAKWLAWALDSMRESNLVDAHYNLGKFWDAIEPWKTVNLSPKEWGDLMTLDSQANWVLGNWYDAALLTVQQVADGVGTVDSALQWVVPQHAALQWITDAMGWNVERNSLKQAADDLMKRRADAYRNAKDLASQAVEALKTAGAPLGQAQNTMDVTSRAVDSIPSRDRFTKGMVDTSFQPLLDQLPAALKAPFGIAWYWWAAGAAALVLLPILLAPSPRITIARD